MKHISLLTLREQKPKTCQELRKKRGGKTVSKRELIIVGMVIDDNDRIDASVLGNDFYKTQSIRMKKQFGDKLEKESMFTTDSKISLSLFSKNNDLNHIKIPRGHRATFDGKYNINTINGIHSEFRLLLNHFKEYLQDTLQIMSIGSRRRNIFNIILIPKNNVYLFNSPNHTKNSCYMTDRTKIKISLF